MTGDAMLHLLVPPLEFIGWLESVFEAKRQKGQRIPATYIDWFDLVKCIRTDLPCELDTLTTEQWQEASERVGRYVTSADAPVVQRVESF